MKTCTISSHSAPASTFPTTKNSRSTCKLHFCFLSQVFFPNYIFTSCTRRCVIFEISFPSMVPGLCEETRNTQQTLLWNGPARGPLLGSCLGIFINPGLTHQQSAWSRPMMISKLNMKDFRSHTYEPWPLNLWSLKRELEMLIWVTGLKKTQELFSVTCLYKISWLSPAGKYSLLTVNFEQLNTPRSGAFQVTNCYIFKNTHTNRGPAE